MFFGGGIFMRKYISVLIILSIVISIIGCSNKGRPSDISQEVYDKTIEYVELIEKRKDNMEELTKQEGQEMLYFIAQYYENNSITEKEREILKGLVTAIGCYVFYFENENDKDLKACGEYIAIIKNLLNK